MREAKRYREWHDGSFPSSRGGERLTRVVVGVLLGLIIATLLIYFWPDEGNETEEAAPVALSGQAPGLEETVPPAAPEPGPDTREAEAEAAPAVPELPSLDESDAFFAESLTALVDAPDLGDLLRPPQLVRKSVIIADNLRDRRLPVKYLPLRPPGGEFRVRRRGEKIYLDPANYDRYRPYVSLLEKLDPSDLQAFYRRFASLFQAAYEELGYPGKSFEARLVAVIDTLLQTPDLSGEIELVQPSVHYKFADPALEGLASGQKVLLRMGPENARIVKDKLRRLRELLVE